MCCGSHPPPPRLSLFILHIVVGFNACLLITLAPRSGRRNEKFKIDQTAISHVRMILSLRCVVELRGCVAPPPLAIVVRLRLGIEPNT